MNKLISIPLLKQSIKANWVIWLALTSVLLLLNVQFASLEMTKSLLFVIFYGVMSTILPGIYILITANKLLAGQVDKGSMAYILSNPLKRSTVVITQMTFLIGSLVLMFLPMTLAHILVNAASPFDFMLLAYNPMEGTLDAPMILYINISALFVCIAMSGVCFMLSSICNLTKYSIGFSGTFIGVSILANMMAMFGSIGVDALKVFKYITICSFYDYESVLISSSTWIWKLFISLGISVVTFAIGGIKFSKRDLPL